MADAKQTATASTVAKMEATRLAEEKQADAKAAKGDIPPDLVLVRLSRPCFDSSGVLHGIENPALLPPGDVPTTAKIIAKGEDVDDDDFTLGFKVAKQAEEDLIRAREELRAKSLARVQARAVPVVADDDDEEEAAKTASAPKKS